MDAALNQTDFSTEVPLHHETPISGDTLIDTERATTEENSLILLPEANIAPINRTPYFQSLRALKTAYTRRQLPQEVYAHQRSILIKDFQDFLGVAVPETETETHNGVEQAQSERQHTPEKNQPKLRLANLDMAKILARSILAHAQKEYALPSQSLELFCVQPEEGLA